MKTKVVQHVPRINLSYLKFQIFKFLKNFKFSKIFKFSKFSLVPSFCLTFRHFFIYKIVSFRATSMTSTSRVIWTFPFSLVSSLNNFCFHVYCLCSKVEYYVICQVSNTYVDLWDMLNNFCFYVYGQMS